MRSNEWTQALAVVALFTAIAVAVPVLAQKEQAKDDNLNHFMVVWVQTMQVPEPAQDDVWHAGKKLPASKEKKVTVRTVSAKEFRSKSEAEKFIASHPSDVASSHIHLINEDE